MALTIATRQKRGKLDALCFATAQGVGSLPQSHIPQADVLQWLKLGKQPSNGRRRFDVGRGAKNNKCIVDGHTQDVVDVFALVGDFQNVVLESLASTVFTNQFQIGHELHPHCDMPFTFASFTSSARNVEAEMRRPEAPGFGMGRVRQEGNVFRQRL